MSSPCHIEVILTEKEDVVSKPSDETAPKVKKESKRKQRRQLARGEYWADQELAKSGYMMSLFQKRFHMSRFIKFLFPPLTRLFVIVFSLWRLNKLFLKESWLLNENSFARMPISKAPIVLHFSWIAVCVLLQNADAKCAQRGRQIFAFIRRADDVISVGRRRQESGAAQAWTVPGQVPYFFFPKSQEKVLSIFAIFSKWLIFQGKR